LAPGDYDIEFTVAGFETINKKISILDKSDFQFEITDDIRFKPLQLK
jgi:hypothetical protein